MGEGALALVDIFKHVRAYLSADPALTASLSTRIYPVKLPQGVTFPALTFQRVSGVRFPPLKGRASLARPRYQFDIWTREGADSAFSESQRLGRVLLDRLEGKNIYVLDDDVSPAEQRIVSFEFDSDRDLFDSDVNGGLYRYSADYFIWFQTGEG